MNNASVNSCVQSPYFASLRYIARSEIAGSYGNSVFIFLKDSVLFSTVAVPLYIPPAEGSDFPTSSLKLIFCVCVVYHNYSSNGCDMIV